MFNLLGAGRGRVVFQINDNVVLKIPYNICGIYQNISEYSIYSNNKDKNVYAKCVLNKKNNYLYMEYLKDRYIKKIPENCTPEETKKINDNKGVEAIQVGRDKNGVLKFYDYADNLTKTTFYFREKHIPLFMEYLDSGSTILFEEWIKQK